MNRVTATMAVSEAGEVEAVVYLYPAIHPEVIAMPFALAAGRQAPPDPAKDLPSAAVDVVDGWVVARFG